MISNNTIIECDSCARTINQESLNWIHFVYINRDLAFDFCTKKCFMLFYATWFKEIQEFFFEMKTKNQNIEYKYKCECEK